MPKGHWEWKTNKKQGGRKKGKKVPPPGPPPSKKKKNGSAGKSVSRFPINGAAGVTRAPWGQCPSGNVVHGLDATHPHHLTLPINVGPYTVFRTTTIAINDYAVSGFGFFRSDYGAMSFANLPAITQQKGWAACCGFSSKGQGSGHSPELGTYFHSIPQLENLYGAATVAPAAMTVQIMCTKPLAGTGTDVAQGAVYIGASKTQFRLMDDPTVWDTIGQDFVSYQTPRLCTGPKIALRGVKVSAKPFNITELFDFDIVQPLLDDDGNIQWNGTTTKKWSSGNIATSGSTVVTNQNLMLKGFAPIMIYNPDRLDLHFLVTCEWRCRFNYGHPASSTHQVHNASTTGTWDLAAKAMDKLGHGCMDIAEEVADRGIDALKGVAGKRAAGYFAKMA